MRTKPNKMLPVVVAYFKGAIVNISGALVKEIETAASKALH